jgi:ABC-type multidrug transport system fused ATPase/permease subunit
MRIPLREYRELLWRYLQPQLVNVLLLAALICLETALQLINPQLLSTFINDVTTNNPQQPLAEIALFFIVLAILQQASTIYATYISERVGWFATNNLRADLALHLAKLDLTFHKIHTPGELIERVDGDITSMANFFSQFAIRVLGGVLLIAGILVMLWLIDWRVGISLTLFAIIAVIVIVATRTMAVVPWKKFRQVSAELFGFLEERLRGTEDIRSSGAQPYVMRQLFMLTRQRLRLNQRARIIAAVPWSVPVIFFLTSKILSFILIAWLFQQGTLTLGTAFLIYYYIQLIELPIMMIARQLEDFQKASAGLARIRDLFNTQSKLSDGPGLTFPAGPLAVSFEHVSFGYDEEKTVIHDLSFQLQPGQVLGLLGRTGSGKTTVTRLLFRLYDPTNGTILLGGQPIQDAQLADLRRQIGIVTQDVQLFHATIRDNLTLFDHSITDEQIMTALADLRLIDWLKNMPAGLDTMLAANGSGLSAGEAQLLAFTRVFLRDPGLIILDEASSRLDPATERMIENAIDKLLAGRTAIIIAHRLETVERADSILILDNGHNIEYGKRTALLANPTSRFAGLLQTANMEVLA